MMSKTTGILVCAALCLALSAATSAKAGASFSNTLTGFTGDSSQGATQSALAAAGFEVDSTSSAAAAAFSSSGAAFGTTTAGDNGRNYLRTIDDYGLAPFQAFVTFESSDLGVKQGFFGVGRGQIALFGVPDWSTQFASSFTQPENGKLTIFVTNNDVHNNFGDSATAAGLGGGVHRLRMTLDSAGQMLEYAIDVNYLGGAFVADGANAVSIGSLYGPTGWPGERSQIYIGGDDGIVFRDFAVTVVPEPAAMTLLAIGSVTALRRRRRGGVFAV